MTSQLSFHETNLLTMSGDGAPVYISVDMEKPLPDVTGQGPSKPTDGLTAMTCA